MGPGGKWAHFAQLAPISGLQGTNASEVVWRGAVLNLITEGSLCPPGRADGSQLSVIWCHL